MTVSSRLGLGGVFGSCSLVAISVLSSKEMSATLLTVVPLATPALGEML